MNVLTLVLACVLAACAQSVASAQGRGHGGGGGGGGGVGHGTGGAGGGVGRGIDTSDERSRGHAEAGRENASVKSDGRSDAGLERARHARDNARRADQELRDHPGLAQGMHMSANDLRAAYQTALVSNPNLKFGQFVAANRLAANLGGRYPGVTTDAILAGLAQGQSIGRTLQNLGLSSREARESEREAEREVGRMRKH